MKPADRKKQGFVPGAVDGSAQNNHKKGGRKMSDANKSNPVPALPKEPLFTLDLAGNGGVLSPTSLAELETWIQREVEFWHWAQGVRAGSHKAAIDSAIQPLIQALNGVREARQHEKPGKDAPIRERVENARGQIQEALKRRRLPHSTSPLGLRVAEFKNEPLVAIGYLFPLLPVIDGQNFKFDAQDVGSWRGFLTGMMEKYGIVTNVEPAIQSERNALEGLHQRAERLLAAKSSIVDRLEQDFRNAVQQIDQAKGNQQTEFDQLVTTSKAEHDVALQKHAGEMDALQKTFRESMTLRGPVEYWSARAVVHESKSVKFRQWAFGSMGVLALILGPLAMWVLSAADSAKPDAGKLAALVLVGVLGVWAVRLVVRMYLSHTHLAADAEERVTMVKTYLALLEGEKMPSDEDRKLVLAPLFRPATDGIVKDERLPHPILELFTRAGQK